MNEDKGILRELSRANFKKQKVRNIIAVIAIFLTAILITSVISVGISFENAWKGYNDLSAGPGADGAITGNTDELQKILKNTDVEWASLIYKASAEPVLLPKYIGGITTELFAPDQLYYEKNGISLLSGKYPESGDEILISDTLADTLELDLKNQDHLTLNYYRLDGEEITEVEKEFYICGSYSNPLSGISNVYEELYCSRLFLEEENPDMLSQDQNIYVKFKGNLSNERAQEILGDLNAEVGGRGVVMKMAESGVSGTIVAAVFVALIIMLAAFLIIYNVFYISLINDIRFFGTLKTLGTTKGQIRKILQQQMWLLMLPGVLAGVFLGNLLGVKLAPGILSTFAENVKYTHSSSQLWVASVLGILFTAITVIFSCGSAFRTINKISPIEAAHFGGKKNHKVLTVLSLGLGIIMFLLVFTITGSQDITKEAQRYHTADFKIENSSVHPLSNSRYSPVNPAISEKIKELDFVKNVEVFYNARSLPDYVIQDGTKFYDLKGRLKVDRKMIEESNEIERLFGVDYGRDLYEDDWRTEIMGAPADAILREMKGIECIDGEIDPEKFAEGGYIIYQRNTLDLAEQESVDKEKLLQAGDTLSLSFYDNTTGGYTEREVTIMAIVQFGGTDAPYSSSAFNSNTIIMADQMFQEIYPDWQEMISVIKIDVDNVDNYASQEKELRSILENNGGSTAKLTSVYSSMQHAKSNKRMIGLVGGFFSIFFAVIGIVNVVNTFVTEVYSQRLEYTRMQAVGMTDRQLYVYLVKRNFVTCIFSLAVGLPTAVIVCENVGAIPLFTGIKWWIFIVGSILTVLLLLLLSCLIALCLVRNINSKSIVERLHTEE